MIFSLSTKIKCHFIDSDNYYSLKSFIKFTNYFFNDLNCKIINNSDNIYDGMIYDIQDDYDVNGINKINILLCVENCNYWKHYTHYNKYGNYGNSKIKIYLYNHIDKLEVTENYIGIPIIHLQINYLQKFYNIIKPTKYIQFLSEKKKFCLIATNLNADFKNNIYNMLSKIEKCDLIDNFKDKIKNKSCYHDVELLNLFNEYKFVFVSENSVNDGYITEKIFNCYFSRTIPIYYGSKKIDYYFNNNSFINIVDHNNLDNTMILIKNILNNNELYQSYINSAIINNSYDNEDYKNVVNNFLQNNI